MVGLIRNRDTNKMSPQFHVVYDKLFQTVHSFEGEPPYKWTDLLLFDCLLSDFDHSDFLPELYD